MIEGDISEHMARVRHAGYRAGTVCCILSFDRVFGDTGRHFE